MLMIEGPDMVGKTELAAVLVEELARIGAACGRDKFGLPESDRMLEECRTRIRRLVVTDRCWPSEVIYGWTVRGAPKVSPEECARMVRLYRDALGRMVVIRATPEAYDRLVALHHHRGEAFTADQCRAVNAAYSERFFTSRPTPTRDWPMPSPTFYYTVGLDAGGNPTYPSADRVFVKRVAKLYARAQGLGPPEE